MKSPEEIAKSITDKVAKSAFDFFKNKKIRRLIELEKFEQIEQDRIFNEIVASGLTLGVLMFKNVSQMTKGEKSDYFNELQTELTSRYRNMLMEIGVEKKFADMWKGLILMRVDEYKKDYNKHKKILPDPSKSNPWLAVVAIGGYHHIKRGQGNPQDPFYREFLKWTKEQAITISKAVL